MTVLQQTNWLIKTQLVLEQIVHHKTGFLFKCKNASKKADSDKL